MSTINNMNANAYIPQISVLGGNSVSFSLSLSLSCFHQGLNSVLQLGYTFLPCVLSGLSYAPQYLSNSSESLGKDCILANDVDSVIVPIDACGGDGALAFARSKQHKVSNLYT